MHRFAILIPAHNESKVVGNLIDSLKRQAYPAKNIDVFVVADNCIDNTADVARRSGAIVYERVDKTKVGKGYALNYLFKKIDARCSKNPYDAYIVFDADNLVNKEFIGEIDKVYTRGFRIVSSFRNSKNYDTSWLSATSSMYVLYQSNLFRHKFARGVDCAVSGTGFLVGREIIEKYNNWEFFTLGEDTEFSVRAKEDGIKIGYADDAIFYDEQPVTLRNFWDQRLRWVRGHLQVIRLYKKSSAVLGMDALSVSTILMLGSLLAILIVFAASLVWHFAVWPYLIGLVMLAYIPTLLVGVYVVGAERRRICAKRYKVILYIFLFPAMIFLFILAGIVALFSRSKKTWNTMHYDGRSIVEVEQR